MVITLKTVRFYLRVAAVLLLSLATYSLVHAQTSPGISAVYNQGSNVMVDCSVCLGPNRAASTGTLNKQSGGSASVTINAKNPSDSGDETGTIVVPSSLGVKFGDYVQLCTNLGCTNYIYVNAGATNANPSQPGAIQYNPQTGQSQYVTTPPPREIPVTLPTCTLSLVTNDSTLPQTKNGDTIKLADGASVSVTLSLSSKPPVTTPLPYIDWDHGQRTPMSASGDLAFTVANPKLQVEGFGRISVIYPYCSNKAEIYVVPATTSVKSNVPLSAGGGDFDCALHIFRNGTEVQSGDSIRSGDQLNAVLNVSGGTPRSESVIWGDLGSTSMTGVYQGNKVVYTSDPNSPKTITADKDITMNVAIRDGSICKQSPVIPLKVLGGAERTVQIQVTDIYDTQDQAQEAAQPKDKTTSPTWTDNQCGSSFGNYSPRCKVFTVTGKNGDDLKIQAKGSTTDTGFWSFTKDSKQSLCVRYMSNVQNHWKIACSSISEFKQPENAGGQTAAPTTAAPTTANQGCPDGQILCGGTCQRLIGCKGSQPICVNGAIACEGPLYSGTTGNAPSAPSGAIKFSDADESVRSKSVQTGDSVKFSISRVAAPAGRQVAWAEVQVARTAPINGKNCGDLGTTADDCVVYSHRTNFNTDKGSADIDQSFIPAAAGDYRVYLHAQSTGEGLPSDLMCSGDPSRLSVNAAVKAAARCDAFASDTLKIHVDDKVNAPKRTTFTGVFQVLLNGQNLHVTKLIYQVGQTYNLQPDNINPPGGKTLKRGTIYRRIWSDDKKTAVVKDPQGNEWTPVSQVTRSATVYNAGDFDYSFTPDSLGYYYEFVMNVETDDPNVKCSGNLDAAAGSNGWVPCDGINQNKDATTRQDRVEFFSGNTASSVAN